MRYAIALLAVAGLVVSYLALRVHYSTDVQPCDINEHWDCGVVNHSPFAMVGPVPVAAIGMAGYVLLAGLAMLGRRTLVAAGAVVGLAFALYLSHVEKDVLTVWCLYCVISQGLIFLIAVLSTIWVRTARRAVVALGRPSSGSGLGFVVGLDEVDEDDSGQREHTEGSLLPVPDVRLPH